MSDIRFKDSTFILLTFFLRNMFFCFISKVYHILSLSNIGKLLFITFLKGSVNLFIKIKKLCIFICKDSVMFKFLCQLKWATGCPDI